MAVDPKSPSREDKTGQDIYSNQMEVENMAGGDPMAAFLSQALDGLKAAMPAGQTGQPVAGEDPDMALALQIQAQMDMDIEFGTLFPFLFFLNSK